MNHELTGMFESVDRLSVEGFLSYLTDDVVFRSVSYTHLTLPTKA